MTTTIQIDKLPRIIKGKRKLEKKLNVKITYQGTKVSIEGKPEDEYIAQQVLEALNYGFPFSTALLIIDEEFMFVKIPIKSHTKRTDLERIKGRIIGTQGKTLSTLAQLTGCFFEIKDNQVGIVGDPERIEAAQNAIISIIKGSKQTNVYSFLEKNRPEPIVDLGLKG